MRSPLAFLFLSTPLIAACSASRGHAIGDHDAGGGSTSVDGGAAMDAQSSPQDAGPIVTPDAWVDPFADCDTRARWVYVVDQTNRLLRFEPDTLAFTDIGTLHCPAISGATPFSMAVDREAVAWVLFTSGELFRVSTLDASCEATSFEPGQHGMMTFGMGFASDGPGSPSETLYIAGGGFPLPGTPASFAKVDFSTLRVTPIGMVPGWPELTGTGAGELWGFFPQTAQVHHLDKSTGSAAESFSIPDFDGTTSEAWAFAFWGGRFYMFVKTPRDTSTVVRMLDPRTGMVTTVVPDSGLRIVGAGVSTCAPVEVI